MLNNNCLRGTPDKTVDQTLKRCEWSEREDRRFAEGAYSTLEEYDSLKGMFHALWLDPSIELLNQ